MNSNIIDIEVEIAHRTEKAVLELVGPKSIDHFYGVC